MAASPDDMEVNPKEGEIQDSYPSKSFRLIGGHEFKILFWPIDRWKRLPKEMRPKTAHRQGRDGWIDIISPSR